MIRIDGLEHIEASVLEEVLRDLDYAVGSLRENPGQIAASQIILNASTDAVKKALSSERLAGVRALRGAFVFAAYCLMLEMRRSYYRAESDGPPGFEADELLSSVGSAAPPGSGGIPATSD